MLLKKELFNIKANPYSDSKIFVQSVIEQQAFIDINNTYLINQLKNGKSAKGYLLFRKLPVIDSLCASGEHV